jgi:vancomycin resistance protein YoaR
LAVAGVLMVLYATWAVDLALSRGEAMRNTVLVTSPVGGLDRAGIEEVVTDLDTQLGTRSLLVTVGDTTVTTDPASLGASLDTEHLVDRAVSARRSLNPITGPIQWISSFFGEEVIELTYLVDESTATAAATDVIGAQLGSVVEPDLTVEEGAFIVIPGATGTTVDPAELIDALPSALAADGELVLTLAPVEVPPATSTEQIEALAAEATAATEGITEIQVLDQTAEFDTVTVRSWVSIQTDGDEPGWTINPDAALASLGPAFPALGTKEQQAHFDVVDGTPVIIPATETVVCCSAASLDGLAGSLAAASPSEEESSEDDPAPSRVVTLEPEIVDADQGVAELESLGIVEEVSTFTTNHQAGQNRVTNIQRFADIVRGAIVRPGEQLSLNDYVGQRTIEKGFVADGAIANGVMEDQVGGGVSQFATTFFNASFFAGLEIVEYQSHSLYISRYPRGREATISWPKPDLRIENNTDYGILVWTSYTDTSITVTFYSTKHIEVEALATSDSPQGEACTRVTTPRIRTYDDGRVEEDSVFAVYRPGEGINCDGSSSVPDPEGPTVVEQPGAPDPIPPASDPVTAPESQPTGPDPTDPGGEVPIELAPTGDAPTGLTPTGQAPIDD